MNNEVVNLYTDDRTQLRLTKINEPRLYEVFMHNDDFTPMEFVVEILEKFFWMDRRRATDIMLEAHTKGKAPCGVYTKEIAESKISQVVIYAHTNEHPLICSMEAAE